MLDISIKQIIAIYLDILIAPLTSGWAADGLGHVRHIDDDGLDAVALALHLGQYLGHLVAVEGVGHGAVHVQRHLQRWNTLLGAELQNSTLL